jgi:hypothetical protein
MHRVVAVTEAMQKECEYCTEVFEWSLMYGTAHFDEKDVIVLKVTPPAKNWNIARGEKRSIHPTLVLTVSISKSSQ